MSDISIVNQSAEDGAVAVTIEVVSTEPSEQVFEIEVNAINGEQRSDVFEVAVPGNDSVRFGVDFDILPADGEDVLVTANLLSPGVGSAQAEVPTQAPSLSNMEIVGCEVSNLTGPEGEWRIGDTGEIIADIRNDHPFPVLVAQEFTANGATIQSEGAVTTGGTNPAELPFPSNAELPTAITFEIREPGSYEFGVTVADVRPQG